MDLDMEKTCKTHNLFIDRLRARGSTDSVHSGSRLQERLTTVDIIILGGDVTIYPGEEKYRAVSRCEERYSRRVFVIEGQYLKKALLDNTNNQQTSILSLRLQQITRDSIPLPYQSIVHKRYLPKDIQQALQGFGKKARKGNNSICKVKLSPPLEEDWQGQESTGFDNSGSADKCDSILPLIEQKLLEKEKIHRRTISKKPNKNTKMRLNVRLIRIRDKLVLCLSALAIVFTLLLVMDLQMDLGYSGHHLNPSHARVRIGDPPETDTVYNNFRRKFLQRGNGSREQANNDVTPIIEKSKKSGVMSLSSIKKHDDFSDLMDLIVNGYAVNVDEGVAIISREDREYNPTIGELRKMILNLQALIDYLKQKFKVSKFTLQKCYNLSCKLNVNQADHFLFLERYRNTILELKL
ncbi:hypothetical protein G5I_08603 [Acromyrmex echinatior]|uniref:Uncharacterized protein n=1 Tax=Acromyrmex echinatior TaxID=103372 RepID=F4WRZ6_ACREC|nr:hypothetical protein G5I_08603 [Acromyrmex echinatior]